MKIMKWPKFPWRPSGNFLKIIPRKFFLISINVFCMGQEIPERCTVSAKFFKMAYTKSITERLVPALMP
jgi:hypothetical protein